MNKSVVLLSSGLDSTINLYQALKETEVVKVLTFDYGQKAAGKEIESAQKICQLNDLSHSIIDLTWFKDFTKTSLISLTEAIPEGDEVSMDDLDVSAQTAERVWVPNRNGIFLNIAAAYAEGLGAQTVVPGFNVEEAATFADNSRAYMEALDKSFIFSTANKVQVKCFTVDLDKTQIVRLGKRLRVPFEHIWPCYHSGPEHCKKCESCQRFYRALERGEHES